VVYLPFCNKIHSYTDTVLVCKSSRATMEFHLCCMFWTVTDGPTIVSSLYALALSADLAVNIGCSTD
jgi:hypothetical protein